MGSFRTGLVDASTGSEPDPIFTLVYKTKKSLDKELSDAGYNRTDIKLKLNNVGPIQRIGISEKYDGAAVDGTYESSFKLGYEKKREWVAKEFHKIKGQVPSV